MRTRLAVGGEAVRLPRVAPRQLPTRAAARVNAIFRGPWHTLEARSGTFVGLVGVWGAHDCLPFRALVATGAQRAFA